LFSREQASHLGGHLLGDALELFPQTEQLGLGLIDSLPGAALGQFRLPFQLAFDLQ
jgi:hypothetical protein